MKRTISLVLCLTILLGLLTGLAGATETEKLELSTNMPVYSDYFGSRGFALYLGDTLVPNNSSEYKVYFSNPLLGTLKATPADRQWATELPWTWESNNAVPGQSGYIVVEYGGETYKVEVSTGQPELGFYRDSSCSLDSLLTEYDRDLVFARGSEVSVYVRINQMDGQFAGENPVTASILTWDSNGTQTESTNGCSVELIDTKTAKVTVSGFGGDGNLKIAVNRTGSSHPWELYAWLHGDDSDELKIVTFENENRQELEVLKWQQFFGAAFCYFEINGKRIGNGENVDVRFNNGGLGDIHSTSYSDLSEEEKAAYDWIYSFSGMMPQRSGYLVVRVDGVEYRKYVSTGYPRMGVFTSFDLNKDSYLAFEPIPYVEYEPGESITVYAYSEFESTPEFLSGNADLISVSELDSHKRYSLTFHAPADASGNYDYEMRFGGRRMRIEFVKKDPDTLWAVYQGNPDEMKENLDRRFHLKDMELGQFYKFDLFYKVGNGTLRKIKPGNGVSVVLNGNNLGAVYKTPNDWNPTSGYWVWDLGTAAPGQSGQIVATVNGTDYTCSISTRDTMIGLYTDPAGTWQSLLKPNPNMPIVEVDYPSNGVLKLYLRIHPDYQNMYPTVQITVPDGVDVVQENGGATLTWEDDEEGWGRSWPVQVNLINEETGKKHYFDMAILPIKVLQDAVQVTEENVVALHTLPDCILTEERPQSYFDTTRNMSYFPKVYTDSTDKDYYLGLVSINGPEVEVQPCISYSFNGTITLPYAAVFYTEDSDQLIPLKFEDMTPETREVLQGLYDTLEMKLYPTRVQETYVTKTELPRVTGGTAEWLVGQNYTFNEKSGGGYLVTVHAIKKTDDAKNHEICAYAYLEANPSSNKTVSVKELVDDGEQVTVDVINTYLQNHPQMEPNDRLTLDFTGICGESMALTGTIVLPNHLVNVKLAGDWERYTYLYGGVESHCAAGGNISAFKFFSPAASKDDTTLSDGKTPNYAIYGTTGAVHDKCEFEGYYHAVHIGQDAKHISFGAMGGIFRNNHIGIFVDYAAQNGGSVDSRRCEFLHNDIAIYLKANKHFKASFLNLYEAKFINNTVDMKNESGTLWWTPMSFFWHHPSDDKYETHPSNKENANQWKPVTEGTVAVEGAKGHNKMLDSVIAYPVSVSPDFDAGYFYSQKANVSEVLMSVYPPTKTSMPLNADTGIYTFTFITQESEKQEVSSGTGIMADLKLTDISVQGLSLLSETVDDMTLDVSISRVLHPGAVVLTVSEIPNGFAGTLTVPLGTADDPWFDAKVLCNGKELKSSVVNGEITFDTVEENLSGPANYEIIQIADAIGNLLDAKDNYLTQILVGKFTVQVQTTVDSESAQAMLAAYTADGKMLKVYPVPVKQGYDYTPVSIDNTSGNVAELRVFLLKDLENRMPLCGNTVFPKQ